MEDRARQAPEPQQAVKPRVRFGFPWAIACVLLALLFAWQWYDSRARVDELRGELAQRVRESEADSRDARLSARQAQEAMRESSWYRDSRFA